MPRVRSVLFVLAALLAVAFHDASAQGVAPGLEGAWVLTFIGDPGAPPVEPTQPDTGLIAFDPDGLVFEQLATISPPGVVTTAGLGEWRRVRGGRFAATVRFAVATTGPTGGRSAGFFVQHFRLEYGPRRAELTGDYDWALVDASGATVVGGRGPVSLRRIAR